jgi:uncharacterized protein DUF3857
MNARLALIICLSLAPGRGAGWAQATGPKNPAKLADKSPAAKTPEFPAQIELLETKTRFEDDGSSRKEVYAHVKINNELGVRQFAHLNFEYNRSFEQVEIPLVRITHTSGGTADILPSAITDSPNPAVVDAPAYQDVRVKSVRILGLVPGDALEYRVVTTVSHHPLAPDFWLDHWFDRTGVVSQQVFEVDLPASRLIDSASTRRVEIRGGVTPDEVRTETDSSGSSRSIYVWKSSQPTSEKKISEMSTESLQNPDVALSSFLVWGVLSQRLAVLFKQPTQDNATVSDKALALTKTASNSSQKIEALYSFVSRDITTVDLPLDATGFRPRAPSDILSSGYATPEDKFVLLASLASSLHLRPEAVLTGTSPDAPSQLPTPSLFTRILTIWGPLQWCDPGLEVAPFGLLSPDLRGRKAFRIFNPPESNPLADVTYLLWFTVPVDLPFPSVQKVNVDAILAGDGKLSAKVHYALRGDNELLLRVAFHQAPKDKWKEVAQLLALSDGFRGQVTNITASDPYATHDPFTLEYEITTPKFVDWSNKPVLIPALLPQLGLPDPPAKPAAGQATASINLGTPLDVQTTLTLHLPPGTTAHIPTGTSVERDYATFASQYNAKSSVVTATRRLNFILREVAAGRATDYNAFLRAVQNDEAQEFTLERSETGAPKTKSAEPVTPAPPKPAAAKP